jgi:hypothetical protein
MTLTKLGTTDQPLATREIDTHEYDDDALLLSFGTSTGFIPTQSSVDDDDRTGDCGRRCLLLYSLYIENENFRKWFYMRSEELTL